MALYNNSNNNNNNHKHKHCTYFDRSNIQQIAKMPLFIFCRIQKERKNKQPNESNAKNYCINRKEPVEIQIKCDP